MLNDFNNKSIILFNLPNDMNIIAIKLIVQRYAKIGKTESNILIKTCDKNGDIPPSMATDIDHDTPINVYLQFLGNLPIK